MTDYVVAYSNFDTKLEWIMISPHDDFQSAIRHVNDIMPEMTRSALAIFVRRANDTRHWSLKRPVRMYNRYAISTSRNITPDLSGLINARESDWF